MKLTDDDQELIDWFTQQDLPKGHFKINGYMTTEDLDLLVELAIDSLKRGNNTSRTVLRDVCEKLLTSTELRASAGDPTDDRQGLITV